MEQLSQELRSLEDLFEPLQHHPHRTVEHSFTSLEPMTPCEALQYFLAMFDVQGCVQEDLSTMVFLRCDGYDFQIVVEANDEGDCYTHGIYVFVNDGDPR